MAILKTNETFIEQAKQIHKNKYNYSKVNYINNHTKICIICPEHGEFWQTPNAHLSGKGCFKCSGKKLNTEEWIKRFRNVHGNEYDYSKVEYKSANTKICIICPEHGEFWQKPNNHLNGNKCPVCNPKKKITQENIIKRFKEVHGERYDYSKTIYKNMNDKIDIRCLIHGIFKMEPHNHLKGYNCPCCAKEKQKQNKYLTQNEVIERFKNKHRDKYDYSKVVYEDCRKKVCIICSKHGEFWQTPHSHMKGCGCPKCKTSKLELLLYNIFKDKNIEFIHQYRPDFLKISKKSQLSLDFYIPSLKIAIECQGKQHYADIKYFGGQEEYTKRKKRDQIKFDKCLKEGIKILYFADKEYINGVITDIKDLLMELKNASNIA